MLTVYRSSWTEREMGKGTKITYSCLVFTLELVKNSVMLKSYQPFRIQGVSTNFYPTVLANKIR